MPKQYDYYNNWFFLFFRSQIFPFFSKSKLNWCIIGHAFGKLSSEPGVQSCPFGPIIKLEECNVIAIGIVGGGINIDIAGNGVVGIIGVDVGVVR